MNQTNGDNIMRHTAYVSETSRLQFGGTLVLRISELAQCGLCIETNHVCIYMYKYMYRVQTITLVG